MLYSDVLENTTEKKRKKNNDVFSELYFVTDYSLGNVVKCILSMEVSEYNYVVCLLFKFIHS